MKAHASIEDVGPLLTDVLTEEFGANHAELAFSPWSTPTAEDGVTVFLARDAAGTPRAVALCSGSASPDMVERAMARAAVAKVSLGPDVGATILNPLAAGRLRGLSYAVLPYCERLTDGRPKWWLQRAMLRPALFEWLWRMNERSVCDVATDDVALRFATPLNYVASLAALSEPVRCAARDALTRLDGGVWAPKHVLMHGDLWKGNILLRPRRSTDAAQPRSGRVVVTDWAGSEVQGYAIYDLVRLARSMRLDRRQLRREINRHCGVLGCEMVDAKAHLLAALGHLAMNLEYFPFDAYVRTAEACFLTIESAAD